MFLGRLKQNNSGLTLIEVMVVVAIMVTMNTMLFLSNRSVNTGRSVEMSAYRLASEIRKMQSYTLNLQNYKNGVYPLGGWGIYVNTSPASNNVYRTFADGHTSVEDHKFDTDMSENFQILELPNRVKINRIKYNSVWLTNPATVHLTFEPPDPATYICNVNCNGTELEIELTDDAGAFPESVIVNKFGLIEVN